MEPTYDTRKKAQLETEIMFRSAYLQRSGIEVGILYRIYEKALDFAYGCPKGSTFWINDRAVLPYCLSESLSASEQNSKLLAVLWAEAVLSGTVSDELYEEAIDKFSEDGLMNLTVAITVIGEMIDPGYFMTTANADPLINTI